MSKEAAIIGMNVEQHSQAIKDAVSSSIEGFILVGERVAQAQKELAGDDFETLFGKSNAAYVGMGIRQGYRFLAIAKGQKKLLKFKGDLPSDVTQLDQVSGMTEKEIKAGIKAEVIGPDMNRGDITKWRNAQDDDDDQRSTPMIREGNPDITDAVVIKDEIPEPEEEDNTRVYDATKVVLTETHEDDRVRVIKGFMKKWEISLTDLT